MRLPATEELRRLRSLLPLQVVLILVALWATADHTSAQVVENVIIQQNAVIERFEPPVTRQPTFGLTIAADVAGVPADQAERVRFRLTSISVVGANTLPVSMLEPLWRDKLGAEVSVADIGRILDEIEDIYRRNDYFALALAPPQDFGDGRIEIIVYESYVREVVIKGDVPDIERRLDPYIQKIVAMVPVRISRLERYLLLMADLAGISLDALISKIPDEPGAALLELDFGFTRKVVLGRFDDFGTEEIGPFQLSANAQFNDVFGAFESTTGLAVTNPFEPEELVFLRLSQKYPFGPSGLSAGYEIGHIISYPGGELADLDVVAETTDGKIYLSYPFLRTIQRNFIATVALEAKDSSVDIGGTAAARDRFRWLSVAGAYDDTILGNNIVTEISFSQGLDGLGSNGDNTDFSFLAVEGNVSRDLTETTSVVLRFAGQLALTQIPAAMTFDLGGEAFTPAFDTSTVAGEDGIAVALELNRQFQTPWQWLPAVTLFSFVDYGAVWNDPGVSEYSFASLGSVGAGIRARVGRHANVSAFVAVPYKDEPDLDASGDPRLRFAAGLRF